MRRRRRSFLFAEEGRPSFPLTLSIVGIWRTGRATIDRPSRCIAKAWHEALHGLDVKCTDGIIAGSPEETMRNVGRLSTQGMIDTDRTILDIMIRKQFDT